MSRFADNLRRLGFATYGEYLASPHWLAFRERYRASGASMKCAVCGVGRIQLHHHTYERLGAESLEDVTPLCRPHHEAVHAWLKSSGKIFVKFTHVAIAELSGKPVVWLTPKPKPKSNKQRKRQKRALLRAAKCQCGNDKKRSRLMCRKCDPEISTPTKSKAERLSTDHAVAKVLSEQLTARVAELGIDTNASRRASAQHDVRTLRKILASYVAPEAKPNDCSAVAEMARATAMRKLSL